MFDASKRSVFSDVKKQLRNILNYALKGDKTIDELSEVIQNSYKVNKFFFITYIDNVLIIIF